MSCREKISHFDVMPGKNNSLFDVIPNKNLFSVRFVCGLRVRASASCRPQFRSFSASLSGGHQVDGLPPVIGLYES